MKINNAIMPKVEIIFKYIFVPIPQQSIHFLNTHSENYNTICRAFVSEIGRKNYAKDIGLVFNKNHTSNYTKMIWHLCDTISHVSRL